MYEKRIWTDPGASHVFSRSGQGVILSCFRANKSRCLGGPFYFELSQKSASHEVFHWFVEDLHSLLVQMPLWCLIYADVVGAARPDLANEERELLDFGRGYVEPYSRRLDDLVQKSRAKFQGRTNWPNPPRAKWFSE